MSAQPFKALIVEDEVSFAALLKETLENQGHTVECVVSIYEGLARARNGDFDVVLTDLVLPGPSGLEPLGGLQIISQLRVAKSHLPVILMTAHPTVAAGIDWMNLAQ